MCLAVFFLFVVFFFFLAFLYTLLRTHSKTYNMPGAFVLCQQHFCFFDPVIKCSLGKSCVVSIASSDFSLFLCVFYNIISMPFNCYTLLCICCLLDAFTRGLRNYVCSSSSVSMPCSPNINADRYNHYFL